MGLFLFVLVVFSTIATATAASKCNFEQNTNIPLSSLRRCFDEIKFNKKEAQDVISKLEKLSEMFVFREQSLTPPGEYADREDIYKLPPVDVLTRLKEIGTQASMSSYENDFYFQSAVSDIYLPMKDPHTLYYKPLGYGRFSLILPVTVAIENKEDVSSRGTGQMKFVLTSLPEKYKFATSQFRTYLRDHVELSDSRELNDYLGLEVVSINNLPVQEAIQEFADNISYISRNPHSRFNRALKTDFYLRSLRVFNMPPQTVSKCEDSIEEDLPNEDKLMCSDVDHDGIDKYEVSEEEEINAKSTMNTEQYEFVFSNGKKLIVPVFAIASVDINDVNDIINYNKPQNTIEEVSANDNKKISPMVRFAKEINSFYEGTSFEIFKSAYPADIQSQSISLKKLSGDKYAILYGITDKAKSAFLDLPDYYDAFMVIIPTFGPDSPAEFVNEMLQFSSIIKKFKSNYNEMPKLIVNVAGNGGGYITLGYRSLHLLTSKINPLFGKYTVRRSELAEFFSMFSDFSTQERFRLDDWYQYDGDEWYAKNMQKAQFTLPDGNKVETLYSGVYTFDLAYDEVQFKSDFDRLFNEPSLDIDPASLYFVTDGSCGSTCACFIKRAREARAGVFLGIGGNPQIAMKGVDMDVASFAGGSVMDTDFIFKNDKEIAEKLEKKDLTDFNSSALHRFAFEQVYSWNYTNLHKPDIYGGDYIAPAEFINNPVDDYIYYWPQPGPDTLTSEATLLNIANGAYIRMNGKHTKANENCYKEVKTETNSNEYRISNGIIGKMCFNGNYDDTKLTFMTCKTGYVLTESGKCVVQHPKWSNYVKPKTDLTWLYVIIAIVLVVGIAYAVMGVIVCQRRKRGVYEMYFDPIRCKKPTAPRIRLSEDAPEQENTHLLEAEDNDAVL